MMAIYYFSSKPDSLDFMGGGQKKNIYGSIAHFGEYAGLYGWIYFALSQSESFSHQKVRLSLFLALLYALSDEIHQSLVPGREGDLADVSRDALGIIAGLISIEVISHLRRRLFSQ